MKPTWFVNLAVDRPEVVFGGGKEGGFRLLWVHEHIDKDLLILHRENQLMFLYGLHSRLAHRGNHKLLQAYATESGRPLEQSLLFGSDTSFQAFGLNPDRSHGACC